MLESLASNATIVSGFPPEPFPTILGAAFGAFLSFLLFVLWDTWRTSNQDKAERKRILNLLAVESCENVLRGAQIQRILREELANASMMNVFLIASPPLLSSDGWTIAKAGNLLKHIGERNLQRWILAYSNLAMVNDNLRGRELFKETSRAISSYNENMRRYDEVIIDGTGVFLQRNQEALNTLPNEVRVPTRVSGSL